MCTATQQDVIQLSDLSDFPLAIVTAVKTAPRSCIHFQEQQCMLSLASTSAACRPEEHMHSDMLLLKGSHAAMMQVSQSGPSQYAGPS